ncbi:MAG: ExbD/TolR family protein [Opitutales bacterium]
MPTRKKKQNPERNRIPTESFADVAFLLIVFFIIVTTLQQTDGFLTDIPGGEASDEASEDELTPTVRINSDGTINFNDETVDLPTLRQQLLDLDLPSKSGDERVVMLESDGTSTYQIYFNVMATITQTGGAIAIVEEEE